MIDKSDKFAIKAAVVLLAWLVCLSRAPAADRRADDRPMLPVPPTDFQPVIDGKLDESCWAGAAKTGPLKTAGGA